ncbi:hypothetical protein HDU67_005716 [Dinochytrium kinnereticum]|nr:hypothetical protein HDU67_005716 [Dinochytrium kinnereticum]
MGEDDVVAIAVEKHLLSRLLYANPVCLLTVTAKDPTSDTIHQNVMTISWLTALDNMGHFMCSMKMTRHTYSLLKLTNTFTLNIPVAGMEDLILKIGGSSGKDHDKVQDLWKDGWRSRFKERTTEEEPGERFFTLCNPGWTPLSESDTMTQDNALAVWECAAHLVCRVEEVLERHGHGILFCVIERGFVRESYWDGRNFSPKPMPSTVNPEHASSPPIPPPYLSFLGSKRFASISPLPPSSQPSPRWRK